MENEILLEAIRIIVAKCSQHVAQEAIFTKRAYELNSPVANTRYDHLVQMALADQQAGFTPEERQILADALSLEGTNRSVILSVRLSATEKATLAAEAELATMTLSEYARRKLLGGQES